MKYLKYLKFDKHYFFVPWSIVGFVMVGFLLGYAFGIGQAIKVSQSQKEKLTEEFQNVLNNLNKPTATPPNSATHNPQPNTRNLPPSYTGPQLWEAINTARLEHGVSALVQKDILCTIAAIRLNQILELGKLDGHDGFAPTYDKYKNDPKMPVNVSEFLISGYPTPNQAVEAWLDTLGHKKLITGGEYVWGCVYAQDSFGVAITGY